jgi:hypothetical protein
MPYEILATSKTPALIIYLLDVIPIVFVKAINAYSELLGDIYGGNPAHAF